MRQFTESEETQELLHELEANDVQYEVREHGKIFVDVTSDDTLEGVWSIQYEPYWGAFKMTYFVLEGNELQGAKTVAFNIQQVVENILAD